MLALLVKNKLHGVNVAYAAMGVVFVGQAYLYVRCVTWQISNALNVRDVGNVANVQDLKKGCVIMGKSKRGTRDRYSMYQLQWVKSGVDANDPKASWSMLAEFDTETDAIRAAKLLTAQQGDEAGSFAVERVIREKDSTPKSSRKLI